MSEPNCCLPIDTKNVTIFCGRETNTNMQQTSLFCNFCSQRGSCTLLKLGSFDFFLSVTQQKMQSKNIQMQWRLRLWTCLCGNMKNGEIVKSNLRFTHTLLPDSLRTSAGRSEVDPERPTRVLTTAFKTHVPPKMFVRWWHTERDYCNQCKTKNVKVNNLWHKRQIQQKENEHE